MIIGVAIPAYRAPDTLPELVREVLRIASLVCVVDDCCPNQTGLRLSQSVLSSRLAVLYNSQNLGVGASTIAGFNYLADRGAEILVKLDADGQFSPCDIPRLVSPICEDGYSLSKGNRFELLDHALKMPRVRLVGNVVLSFLTKLTTGYWELFDPTNGLIAISTSSFVRLRPAIHSINPRYFFETDLLYHSALSRFPIAQIPVCVSYDNHVSSLSVRKESFLFLSLHLNRLFKRLLYQYFILDFNPGSLDVLGLLLILPAFLMHLICIQVKYVSRGVYASPGSVAILVVFLIMLTQLSISFLYFDSTFQPMLREKSRKSYRYSVLSRSRR